jgi:hypothetical protein
MRVASLSLLLVVATSLHAQGAEIPLPEHPRPDLERAEWVNLNGDWSFRFDKEGKGEGERWFESAAAAFPLTIHVPFPWGSKLSGVPDEADVAWYARTVRVPEVAEGEAGLPRRRRVRLEDERLARRPADRRVPGRLHPVRAGATKAAKPGQDQRLVPRVDDTPHAFKLEGKQGYGKARGLWQTVYLERAPRSTWTRSRSTASRRSASSCSCGWRSGDRAGRWRFYASSPPRGRSRARARQALTAGARAAHAAARRQPGLYDATLSLTTASGEDRVKTYFGFREIGVAKLPGLGHPYVSLNGKPLYLQLTLDQGWHPDGFYTWPSDAAMREEVLIARRLGLNAIRTHVKVELPRKLYWADRLGVLVMSDVPNSWGEPDAAMKKEWETAFRGMVRRDFNHPSIFSWVLFNEQWGLLTPPTGEKKAYLPETQAWVVTAYDLAKAVDPTRLIEDNSPCCETGGRVKTDLNTWHMYLPGWKWKEELDKAEDGTKPGSNWNYLGGRSQRGEPMLNSECGNVWGYEGSTGDVDWSFDYHAMLDEFRRHPKTAGWLYTEHHDVINEWNGYVRADRSEKETGLGELVPGMSLRDWHGPFYVAIGAYPVSAAKPGETVPVPLWASFLTDAAPGGPLRLRLELVGHDASGRYREWWKGGEIAFARGCRGHSGVAVPMPPVRSLPARDARTRRAGAVRNFTSCGGGGRLAARRTAPGRRRTARAARGAGQFEGCPPAAAVAALDGRKRNGRAPAFSIGRPGRRDSAPRPSRARASWRSSARSSSSARISRRRTRCRATSCSAAARTIPG